MRGVAKTVAAATIMGIALTALHPTRAYMSFLPASPICELAVLVAGGLLSFVMAAFVLGADELRLLLPRVGKTGEPQQ